MEPESKKPGRPPKSGGEYANSRAVESAMLRLRREGKEWVRSREVIEKMTHDRIPNARVVWNRGKTRLIRDHGRLEVRARLDPSQTAVAEYRLRFVQGTTYTISVEHYAKLPEDLKQFYRAIEPPKRSPSSPDFYGAMGDLLRGLSKAHLNTVRTEELEEELIRRERQDPKELLLPGASFEKMRWYRPIKMELLKGFIASRRRAAGSRSGLRSGKEGLPEAISAPPGSRSRKKRTPSRRPAA